MDVFKIAETPGLMSRAERIWLALAAAGVGEGTIVEAGTAYGSSAALMREAAPRAVIHTFDRNDILNPQILDRDSVQFHETDAPGFVREHPDLRADLLFIDADHSFGGVLADYQALSPLLGPGGLLALHDVVFQHYGVRLFCDALIRGGHLEGEVQVDTLCLGRLRKPGLPDPEVFIQVLGEHLAAYEGSGSLSAGGAGLAERREAAWPAPGQDPEALVIGKGEKGRVFARCMGLGPERLVHSWDVRDLSARYYLCSHETARIRQHLTAIGLPDRNLRLVTDRALSWLCLQDLLRTGGQVLAGLARTELEAAIVTRGLGRLPEVLKLAAHQSGFLHLFFTRFWFPG